jgi:peptidyl-dipeptidase A
MDMKDDVRIKHVHHAHEEDLGTIYHELGHVYYYLAYKDQPFMYENGAHDGFHEAIGDTVLLSMTPGYLAKVGLVKQVPDLREAVLNEQMKIAARQDRLPALRQADRPVALGRVLGRDQARGLQQGLVGLREKYQGVSAPVERTEADFDPGAKFHVPGNTPYTRYFLSFVIQFQFHRALCEAAGYKGPLHECSVLRQQGGRRRSSRPCCRWARASPGPRRSKELTGTRADGRQRHPRVLRAPGIRPATA